MKWLLLSITIFLAPFLGAESKVELLESQASHLLRLADDKIHLAKALERQADLSGKNGLPLLRKAEQYRLQAMQHVAQARQKLEEAIDARRELLGEAKRKLEAKRTEVVRIGSWNLENFGEAKQRKTIPYRGNDTALPQVVADVLLTGQFAAVAIQEVEGDTLEPIEAVVKAMNQGREVYRLTYPEKMGVSAYRAEYLPIIFNNELLRMETQGMMRDIDMQRPPHYAYFSVRADRAKEPSPGKKCFSFVLVSVHLAPKRWGKRDNPRREDFRQLSRVFRKLRKKFGEDEDIVIAGDFNCDPNMTWRSSDRKMWKKLTGKGVQLYRFTNAEGDHTTTSMAQGDRFNDNMIWMKPTEEDWNGKRQVYDIIAKHFDGNEEIAHEISDHLPIWSSFYTNRDTN